MKEEKTKKKKVKEKKKIIERPNGRVTHLASQTCDMLSL